MIAILYINLLITWLLASTHTHTQKQNSHSVSFYNLLVTIHGVFQQRNRVPQTDGKDIEQNIL